MLIVERNMQFPGWECGTKRYRPHKAFVKKGSSKLKNSIWITWCISIILWDKSKMIVVSHGVWSVIENRLSWKDHISNISGKMVTGTRESRKTSNKRNFDKLVLFLCIYLCVCMCKHMRTIYFGTRNTNSSYCWCQQVIHTDPQSKS